jgi:hypothetical protein
MDPQGLLETLTGGISGVYGPLHFPSQFICYGAVIQFSHRNIAQ